MRGFIFFILFLFCSIDGFCQTRYISQTTKKIVYTRDGGRCQCCSSSDLLEFDHIIPFSCGGSSDHSNIQLLCRRCNRSKSNSCYCKVHQNKVGNNCCDDGSKNERSSGSVEPSRVAKQCSAITKKGAQCRNMTKDPNGRCHYHK